MRNIFTATWQNPLTAPKREIVGRLALSMCGMVTSSMSLLAPQTFTYKMVQAAGVAGVACALFLFVASSLLLADAFINEILPPKIKFEAGRRNRQWLWMACGLIQIAFSFQVLVAGMSISLGLYLIVFGLCSELLAFIDAATDKMHRRLLAGLEEWPR